MWSNRLNCSFGLFWGPCFCELRSLSAYLVFSHHACFFCNQSLKSEMTQTSSSNETMLFICRPCMLNLRRYLSWLSALLDKQQNNVQASSGLQLTTFQRRPNLVQSQDNLIVLERRPNVCGWPEASHQRICLFFCLNQGIQTVGWSSRFQSTGMLTSAASLQDGDALLECNKEKGHQVRHWSPVLPVGAFPGLRQGLFP